MRILCLTPVKHIKGVCNTLASYGEVNYAEHVTKDEAANLISQGYDVLFVNPNKMTYRLDEHVLRDSDVLCIATASTGTNHIDLEYCSNNNIQVISLTSDDTIYEISSTAEHALALMLALIRNIPSAYDSVKKGHWDYQNYIGRQLNRLTVGIVGYGRLGNMMSRYCNGLGMRILVCDPYRSAPYPNVTLVKLAQSSDVVSIHVHLNKETTGLIDRDFLGNMRSNSYLVNTSRGGLVNESAVIESLENGTLAGYATDVVADELGCIDDSEIIKRADDLNILITPHIGGMTIDAQEIAYNRVAEKIKELM